MNPFDDDDRPLGRPPQAPRPLPPAAGRDVTGPSLAPPVAATALQEEPRPDGGAGRPKQLALDPAHLSADDWQRIRLARAAEVAEETRRLEEMLVSEPTLVRIPAFLLHPLVGAALLGAAALLGLFLFAQV